METITKSTENFLRRVMKDARKMMEATAAYGTPPQELEKRTEEMEKYFRWCRRGLMTEREAVCSIVKAGMW